MEAGRKPEGAPWGAQCAAGGRVQHVGLAGGGRQAGSPPASSPPSTASPAAGRSGPAPSCARQREDRKSQAGKIKLHL